VLRVLLLVMTASWCMAQSVKDCRLVFIQPMPESLDRFVSAELLKWGVVKVVTVEEKADCLASFGRQASKVEVRSSGSVVVPTETTVKSERADDLLPDATCTLIRGISKLCKGAALELVHRNTSVVVWADSKADFTARPLAHKLVDQLKKDYQKQR